MLILPPTTIFRPDSDTPPEPPVALIGPETEIQLVVVHPITVSPPVAVIAPSIMSLDSLTLMEPPLATSVLKSFDRLFRVMALPVATKFAVPVTVIAVPAAWVMAPPVEFTERLLAEIVPSTVAFEFTSSTAPPLAAIFPADEKLLTVIKLPEAINCELPETVMPVPVA